MKTKYSQRISSIGPVASITLAIGAFLLVCGIVLRVFFPDVVVSIASPLWKLGDSLSAVSTSFQNTQELIAERAVLREENETLVHENELLRTRLADLGTKDDVHEGISAGVLARPPLAPYDVLVVGQGSSDGVSIGARVFAKGVPVGTVEEVGMHTARVVLFSTANRESEGWVGEEKLPVTLVGEGSGAFIATIPHGAPVVAGDTVYLPGPGALPSGSVYAVESNPSSASAKLIITPLVNPFTITWVRIVP